jgi:hypothetical protein
VGFVPLPKAGEFHADQISDGREQDSLFRNNWRRKTRNRLRMIRPSLFSNEQEMDGAFRFVGVNPCAINIPEAVRFGNRSDFFEVLPINRHVNIWR